MASDFGWDGAVQVVFLPGALIQPTAYAPLARTMARRGYPSYVARFEFNLGEWATLLLVVVAGGISPIWMPL